MSDTPMYDRAATVLGLSCVAHCVALPLVAVALPFLGAVAEVEWVHWLLTGLAISASAMVVFTAHDALRPSFLVPAVLGISLIASSLFAETFGLDETLPTLAGGLLLASAHVYRLIKHN